MLSDKFKFFITSVDHVRGFHDRKITHLISIGSVSMKKPYIKHFPVQPKVFRFEFDDIRQVGDPAGPQEVHIRYLLSAANIIKLTLEQGNEVNLLIHCHAGVSRSTAAAFIILNYLAGPGKERECLNDVFSFRPCMVPNEAMVTIADNLMARNGAMIEVVNTYNKGLELTE